MQVADHVIDGPALELRRLREGRIRQRREQARQRLCLGEKVCSLIHLAYNVRAIRIFMISLVPP